MDKNYSPVGVHCKGGACNTKVLNLINETVWYVIKAGMRKSFKAIIFQ
jgi:hypothetical protein